MTHTAEPMTLERAKDICLQWIAATAGNGSMCTVAESRIKEVFAELAKQREAEPVACNHTQQRNAVEVTDEMVSQAISAAESFSDLTFEWKTMRCALEAVLQSAQPTPPSTKAIAQPVAHAPDCNLNMADIGQRIRGCDCDHTQQRNAVEVTEQMVRTFQLADMQFSESAANRGELIDPALAVEFALKQTLSAVVSRDREDAERYRWLRDHDGRDDEEHIEVFIGGESFNPGHLDKAIDAARRENKP